MKQKVRETQEIQYFDHKISLKYKRIQVIQTMFFAYNRTKLENNKRKIFWKALKYFRNK